MSHKTPTIPPAHRPARPTPGRWLRCLGAAGAAVLALAGAVGCGRADAPAPVTILAAASLTDALPEAAAAWRAAGGEEVRFGFGASSRIVPQVLEGAAADGVVSADEAWIGKLVAGGKADAADVVRVARNELVLVVPADRADPPTDPTGLRTTVRRLALAGEQVPAGAYARAALARAGVTDLAPPWVVTAEDVRLALRWVALGEADAGIVYRTDARAEPRVKVAFAFPAGSHPPIVYPAAPVRGAARADAARRFVRFLAGPAGQAVLARHGFVPP